jgi:molybdate transport system ATP-binding protein
MRPIDSNEVVAVVALGPDGDGARLLSRVTQRSWDQLGLARGVSVYAQVKAVALAP